MQNAGSWYSFSRGKSRAESPPKPGSAARGVVDRTVDHSFYFLVSSFSYCADGLGDREMIDGICALAAQLRPETPIPRIRIQWEDQKEIGAGIVRKRGFFRTPLDEFPLPAQCQLVPVEMLLPAKQPAGQLPPCYLHLASLGESGFQLRRRVALPLIREGFGALFMETAFHGQRKPRKQFQGCVRRLSDLFVMTLSTFLEGRACLEWLHAQGHPRLGVAGYSMGGFLSAGIAALTPHPLAVVCGAAGNCASRTFTDKELDLRRLFDWKAMQSCLEEGQDAAAYFAARLREIRLDKMPCPVLPAAAIVMGAQHDCVVPQSEVLALHDHWKGSELRWISTGHVLGLLLHWEEMRQAIRDAFSRLDALVPLPRD